MEVVDVDPFAALPVTAASRTAAFTRATQSSRGPDERQDQLRALGPTVPSLMQGGPPDG